MVWYGMRDNRTHLDGDKPIHPIPSPIPTPFRLKLKQALVDLVNDPSTLTNGGYLGFGLLYEYAHSGKNLLGGQLKESDRVLVDVCDELGLRYRIRLRLYREISIPRGDIHLLTTTQLDPRDAANEEASDYNYLAEALEDLTLRQVEGFVFVGQSHKPDPAKLKEFVGTFYKEPFTEVFNGDHCDEILCGRLVHNVEIRSNEVDSFNGLLHAWPWSL